MNNTLTLPVAASANAPRFVPDAEDRAAARLGWIGLVATALMCLVFFGWAAMAPLASTAMAEGFVKSDRNRRVVQHQEGGIVSEVRVREGDHVHAGDVLLVLDDAAVRADLRKQRGLLDSELAKLSRIEAERDFADSYKVPAELAPRLGEDDVAADVERERRAFMTHRQGLLLQLDLLARSASEAEQEATAQATQIAEISKAAARVAEDAAAGQTLLQQGYMTKTKVSELERSLHDYRTRQAEAQAQIAQARQKRSELELRALALRNAYRQSAHDEMRVSADRVGQLRAQLDPSSDAAKRQQIVAPASGRLVGLRVATAGSVIAPRDVLAEIVPDETPLVIEGRLRTDAIAQVASGMKAGVRLLAFDQRSMPTLDGRVTQVSADRQVDPKTGVAYYSVLVEVPDTALRAAGIEALTPGMPTEIFLHAGDRSALSYLIDPFTHRLEMALREK